MHATVSIDPHVRLSPNDATTLTYLPEPFFRFFVEALLWLLCLSLTSYKASGDLGAGNDDEPSHAMIMSGHFGFPPTRHENFLLEPEYNMICSEKGGEDDTPLLLAKERGKLKASEEEIVSIKGMISDEFPRIQILDEKNSRFSASGTDFEKDMAFDKEQSMYSTADFSSFHSEATMGNSDTVEKDLEMKDILEPFYCASDSGMSNFPMPAEEDKYDGAGIPCEAWWKRHAASLYAHAKEENTFWSIFVAAAVMGLVILGQKWQQERWQVLHLKWQFGINDEVLRMGRMLNPISRLKEVLVGGHRRGSLIRGSTPAER
ncbi:unnamed protein product [Fraxinus pennsylvanica]|uniref:ATG8-interacting protein 1 n=1 Tax=Fraxinus pennsylvanica TaxID=56036 RepID=A0AAD1Z1D1_9LAMI|nr:unnamed protein product [Fraxinus pennsylvanica]